MAYHQNVQQSTDWFVNINIIISGTAAILASVIDARMMLKVGASRTPLIGQELQSHAEHVLCSVLHAGWVGGVTFGSFMAPSLIKYAYYDGVGVKPQQIIQPKSVIMPQIATRKYAVITKEKPETALIATTEPQEATISLEPVSDTVLTFKESMRQLLEVATGSDDSVVALHISRFLDDSVGLERLLTVLATAELPVLRALHDTKAACFDRAFWAKVTDHTLLSDNELWHNQADDKSLKVLFLASNDLYYPKKNIKVIGLNYLDGEWSNNIATYVKMIVALSQKDFKVVLLDIELRYVQNKKFMDVLDFIINPGADDTFGDFYAQYQKVDSSYLFASQSVGLDHEYSYQIAIDYVKESGVSYLGLCNGNQHIILNSGGTLTQIDGYNNGKTIAHRAHAVPGSMLHFLAMNSMEQKYAITCGRFGNIAFPISTQHNYAGTNNLGSLQLGFLSEEGVVQGVASAFNQIGVQFHPEHLYSRSAIDTEDRNGNILRNIFKFLFVEKEKLSSMSQCMQEELEGAYRQRDILQHQCEQMLPEALEDNLHDIYLQCL